jgi:hypothetical protein
MPVEDLEMVRSVRREMARRMLNTGDTHVSASRGVVHLTGRVQPVKGHEEEFEQEIHTLYRVLKQRPGVRDVCLEWNTGEIKVSDPSRRSAERGPG